MIAIVNYNVGNIRSVEKAFQRAAAGTGHTIVVTPDPEVILQADGVVLPGVGAFGACMTNLQQFGLEEVVREVVARQTPLLGICVGMQMLFEESEEMGCWPGLGFLPGKVRRFPATLRVPQIGWNQLHHDGRDPLLKGVPDGAYAYFVHSYYCDAADPNDVVATTDYGIVYPSVVRRGHIWGVQFHPEKSHRVGLRMLRNFVGIVEALAAERKARPA